MGSFRLIVLGAAFVAAMACGGTSTAPTDTPSSSTVANPATPVTVVPSVYDLDARGVPDIVTADYVDLAVIDRISLFRSGIGHDYSDSLESCRSMKHYFMPRSDVDWSSVTLASPVAGTVASLQNEMTFGIQVQITPAGYPAFTVTIFHVTPDASVTTGLAVTAGQRLGHHVGSQTMSDVAVRVETPTGTRLVSYFDAMTDAVFDHYRARGVVSRQTMIISRVARDASPLSCQGETFASSGALDNWFTVK